MLVFQGDKKGNLNLKVFSPLLLMYKQKLLFNLLHFRLKYKTI
jgi:hypothetical protein